MTAAVTYGRILRADEHPLTDAGAVVLETRGSRAKLVTLRADVPFTINGHTTYCASVKHTMAADMAERRPQRRAIRPFREGQRGTLVAVWEEPRSEEATA